MAKNAAEQPEKEGTKSKKMLIIVIVAVLVLVGGGVGAYFMLFTGGPEAVAAEAPKDKLQEGEMGPVVNIESFIVNILAEEGTRYLKAAMTLEVDNDGTVEEVTQRMPQVKDAILLLVSSKTFNDLQDLQGKLQLRAEISQRLNDILKTGQVRQIYFTDFVVQ